MYVCNCYGVTEQDVIQLAASGSVTFKEVARYLKDKGSCCKCLPKTLEVFREEYSKNITWHYSPPIG